MSLNKKQDSLILAEQSLLGYNRSKHVTSYIICNVRLDKNRLLLTPEGNPELFPLTKPLTQVVAGFGCDQTGSN